MSEYQYFEFQAIDRPLSRKEMAELRSYSTRARITPTSFVNDYSSLAEFLRIDRNLIRVAADPAATSPTVADLMKNLEAESRKQSRTL